MTGINPAFLDAQSRFVDARNALGAYEQGHKNQSMQERLNDPEYQALLSNFRFCDQFAPTAGFSAIA